jgi:uroporphyrinogen-III synthase
MAGADVIASQVANADRVVPVVPLVPAVSSMAANPTAASPIMPARIVLTRPQERQTDLMQQLQAKGCDVVAAPALQITWLDEDLSQLIPKTSVTDAQPTPPGASQVPPYDWVVCVSRAAWQGFVPRIQALHWDMSAVGLAAVGQATARAMADKVVSTNPVLCPSPEVPQDSESLWAMLSPRLQPGSRVLIVRGEGGRDWLADQCRGVGVQVTLVSVYRRTQVAWSSETLARLGQWHREGALGVWLITSAESLASIEARFKEQGLNPQALSGVVVIHERLVPLVRRWLATEQIPIKVCQPDDQAIQSALLGFFG